MDHRPLLIAIQALDRIVQPAFGILLGMRRQGIVDARRPTDFFKGAQDQLLVRRRPLEHFDQGRPDA